MKEIIDFSEMGELERLEYIEKELNKEKPTQDVDESNKDFKLRLKQYTRERKTLLKKQKAFKNNLSETFISDISQSIQDANPTWALMNKKILEEFVRLSIRTQINSKGGMEEFKNQAENEEDLRNKIIEIFDNNEKAKNLDESQIIKFNAAWEMGKTTGAKSRNAIKKVSIS